MPYAAKILLDSVNAETRDRLTTFEITYPRFVHAELMTHRLFSRNSASSRAIPIEKMIQRVMEDPAGPVFWGKNQKGMQAAEELDEDDIRRAKDAWLEARNEAVYAAKTMIEIGVHKQIVNRLLEPWMWITVIVSATEYENFFALRCHKDAQPEIQKIAYMMRELYVESTPTQRKPGEWHLPLIFPEDHAQLYEDYVYVRLSTARCARVSYLTHDGRRDPAADLELHDRLAESGHWSPFEHPACAMSVSERSGNFTGWKQYRKNFIHEHHGKRMP